MCKGLARCLIITYLCFSYAKTRWCSDFELVGENYVIYYFYLYFLQLSPGKFLNFSKKL